MPTAGRFSVRRPASPWPVGAGTMGASRPSRARWTTGPSSRRWRLQLRRVGPSARRLDPRATCSPLPPTARVCAWTKPIGCPRGPGASTSTWEPVIVVGGASGPGRAGLALAMPARGGGETLMGASRWPSAHGSSTSWGCSPATSFVDLFPGTGVVTRPGRSCRLDPDDRRPLQEVTRRSAPMVTRRQGPGGRVARVPARRWLPIRRSCRRRVVAGFPTTPRGPRDPRLHPGRRARVADARAVGAAEAINPHLAAPVARRAPAASFRWSLRRTATGRGSPSSRRAAPHADAQRTAPDAPAEGGGGPAPRARGRAPRARGDHSRRRRPGAW